jgi:hypothetical protein
VLNRYSDNLNATGYKGIDSPVKACTSHSITYCFSPYKPVLRDLFRNLLLLPYAFPLQVGICRNNLLLTLSTLCKARIQNNSLVLLVCVPPLISSPYLAGGSAQ